MVFAQAAEQDALGVPLTTDAPPAAVEAIPQAPGPASDSSTSAEYSRLLVACGDRTPLQQKACRDALEGRFGYGATGGDLPRHPRAS
jgi:hypothetical protein